MKILLTNIRIILTFQELLLTLAQTVSNGGNLLVNVGPTKEGIIPVIMQERLKQMGQWLNTNGEAVRKEILSENCFFYLIDFVETSNKYSSKTVFGQILL